MHLPLPVQVGQLWESVEHLGLIPRLATTGTLQGPVEVLKIKRPVEMRRIAGGRIQSARTGKRGAGGDLWSEYCIDFISTPDLPSI